MLLKRTSESYLKPDGRESSRVIENIVDLYDIMIITITITLE